MGTILCFFISNKVLHVYKGGTRPAPGSRRSPIPHERSGFLFSVLPFSAHVILRHHKPGHYSLNVTVGYSMNSKQNKVFSLRLPVATCKSPARVNVNFVAIFSKSDFFCLEFYCVNFFFFFQNFELSRRNSNPKRSRALVISCLQEIPVTPNFLARLFRTNFLSLRAVPVITLFS